MTKVHKQKGEGWQAVPSCKPQGVASRMRLTCDDAKVTCSHCLKLIQPTAAEVAAVVSLATK